MRLRCFFVVGSEEVLFSTDTDPFGILASSGDLEVTMGVGGRRITFCAGYGACVITVDRSKWESVVVVGDASLGAELEKVRFGDGFMDKGPEKALIKVTEAFSREAAS